MTISLVKTKRLKNLPSKSPEIKPQRLREANDLAAVLVNPDVGQTTEPCQMSSGVLYYDIAGSGSLTVEEGQADLQTSSLALVPAGTGRSISVVGATRVLAVQAS